MDCLPSEDLCQIENAMTTMLVKAASDYRVDMDTILIGTFNNRDYYHGWINGKSVIVIQDSDAESYELPDFLPPP